MLHNARYSLTATASNDVRNISVISPDKFHIPNIYTDGINIKQAHIKFSYGRSEGTKSIIWKINLQ